MNHRPKHKNSSLRIFSVLLMLSLLVHIPELEAKTKYRQRFNVEEENAYGISTSVETSEKQVSEQEKQEQQKIEEAQAKDKAASIKQEQTQINELDIQKQKDILDRYKPLIEPRKYDQLMVVKEWAPDLKLNRLPEPYEEILTGRAPNIRLTPYLMKSFAHPAYKAKLNGVSYYLAVNCGSAYGFDDCSTTPHNNFKHQSVYVRFIQSNDVNFNLVKGMRVGATFADVEYLFDANADIHGDGECIKTRQEWLACFDGNKLALNKKRLQMMPAKDARLLRFIKISGKGY